MKRAYYSSSVKGFLYKDNYSIFGEITSNDQFASDDLQKKRSRGDGSCRWATLMNR